MRVFGFLLPMPYEYLQRLANPVSDTHAQQRCVDELDDRIHIQLTQIQTNDGEGNGEPANEICFGTL